MNALQSSPALEFTEQFKRCLHLLDETDKNVFITGKAGTGKSTLLTYFRENTCKQVVVLAPTGVAAVNIHGQTIHSFFRFKPHVALKDIPQMAKEIRNKALYKKTGMIIIDEISMVRSDLLDCVDLFLRTIRKNQLPFGGVQMIFIGDLYQLPPVVAGSQREALKMKYTSPYFFDSAAIQNLLYGNIVRGLEFIELEKIYRQKDEDFIHLLNSIRNKTITEEQIEQLNQRYQPLADGISQDYIFLTTTNDQAAKINQENLDKLFSRSFQFDGVMQGEFTENHLPTEITLSLKKKARVMLLNNDSNGRWVNGTLGTITQIDQEKVWVKLDTGSVVNVEPFEWTLFRSRYDVASEMIENEIIGSFKQYPVRLAWALTIHKSQGKTFDRVVIDLGKGTFSHGQTYVALSRCRSFEGVILKTPIQKKHILMDYRVVRFLAQFEYQLSNQEMS